MSVLRRIRAVESVPTRSREPLKARISLDVCGHHLVVRIGDQATALAIRSTVIPCPDCTALYCRSEVA